MQDLLSMVQNVIGQDGLQALGQELNTDQQQMQVATGSVISTIVGALSKNASTEQGALNLNNALEQDNHGDLLSNILGVISGQSTTNNRASNGAGIIGHILGDKAGVIVDGLSQATGMNSSGISSLLIKLAPVVMSVLGSVKSQNGLNPQGVADVLSNTVNQNSEQNPIMTMAGKLLDRDGDGSMMDDLGSIGMNILGNLFKK